MTLPATQEPLALSSDKERFYVVGTSNGGPVVARAAVLLDGNGAVVTKQSIRDVSGTYHANMGNTTITLAADAATAGRFWLVNTSPTTLVAIKKIYFTSISTTALISLTAPNFTVERITFTGTPSGASVTAAKADSQMVTPVASIRTASTGMAISSGAAAHAFQVHSVLTGVGETRPVDQLWPVEESEQSQLVLRQNEGIVIRQSTAGTLADTRSARVDISWEEFV